MYCVRCLCGADGQAGDRGRVREQLRARARHRAPPVRRERALRRARARMRSTLLLTLSSTLNSKLLLVLVTVTVLCSYVAMCGAVGDDPGEALGAADRGLARGAPLLARAPPPAQHARAHRPPALHRHALRLHVQPGRLHRQRLLQWCALALALSLPLPSPTSYRTLFACWFSL